MAVRRVPEDAPDVVVDGPVKLGLPGNPGPADEGELREMTNQRMTEQVVGLMHGGLTPAWVDGAMADGSAARCRA